MWPLLLVGGGIALFITMVLSSGDDPPVHDPDLPPDAAPPSGFPKSTRYRLVDAILPQLKQASASSGIPLGVLVGWIAKESGGRIDSKTSLGELGLFQLIPGEQTKTGFTDKDRLSSDVTYSINAGLALIGVYMGDVDRLGIAPRGSTFFWKLCKLGHSMGTGAMNKIVAAAKADGSTKNWNDLESFALAHNSELLSATKHSPAKWFPFVNSVFQVGEPFGIGASQTLVGGIKVDDIPDPLDVQ